jgi:hypothetical protein
MQGHWVNARPGDEPRDSGQTEAAGKITECDRKLTQYRAALDEGCNAKTIGAWIAETEAEKARYEIGLRQVAKARERMTEQEIRSIVDKLADIALMLADADADDKSEILRRRQTAAQATADLYGRLRLVFDPTGTGLSRQYETSRAGRGPGACPRAWPVRGRPGWRGPPR